MLSRNIIGHARTSLRSVQLEIRRLNSTANDNPHAPRANVPVPLKQEEGFREMFLMPKRKLQGQLAIERITGRAEEPKPKVFDLSDRLSVRRPRRENMKTDQDWTSVWPAAASFRASVVPLPIRMGYRRHVDRRPPFKTFGNLELMKIPNFLHLTPKHIKQHCEAIKKFCTEFPAELKTTPELAQRYLPLTYAYSDYVHQGTSIRDIRARVVSVSVKLDAFGLPEGDEHAREKLIRLLGKRYDTATNSFTILADRCMTRKQNRDYINYILTALFHESCKVESWEQSQERIDKLKLEYAGSLTESHVAEILANADSADSSSTSDGEPKDGPNVPASRAEKVDEFKEKWLAYRNEPETPNTVRDYEESVRNLLGIEKVVKQ